MCGGFADCLLVVSVLRVLACDIVETGFGCEAGFVLDELGALGADELEGGFEVGELGRVDDVDQCVEREVVVVAEIEGGDCGIEEVAHEGVGEGGGDWGLATCDWGRGGCGGVC